MSKFQTRVISLPKQIERQRKMQEMLVKSDISWSFFDAISGQNLEGYWHHYDRKKRMQFPGHDLKPNEIACFLSHREIWKECVDSGQNFLILEDDAFSVRRGAEINDIYEVYSNISEYLNKGFLVRVSNGERKNIFRPIKKVSEDVSLVRYLKDPLCTTAYFVSPLIAKKLITNSEKFFLPVDNFIWDYGLSGCMVLDLSKNFFEVPAEDIVSTIGERKKGHLNFFRKIKREFFRAIYMHKLRQSEAKVLKNLGE